MAQQDWTLPEPNVSLYTDEMMANAKAYSDTAMVVITRVGGARAPTCPPICPLWWTAAGSAVWPSTGAHRRAQATTTAAMMTP